MKTCSQNCIYCQLCTDAPPVSERGSYAPIDEVLEELKRKLQEHPAIDCITVSGSGEPTLHSKIGKLLKGIKDLTDTMVVVITNSTMLWQKEVRDDLSAADVVMPSLDACDQETFEKINKPAEDISFQKLVDGLIEFRRQFKGQFWLEVFMVDGINTDQAHIAKFKEIIEKIDPDKIQLNTAVRPTSGMNVKLIDEEKLRSIASLLGPKAEVIAKFTRKSESGNSESLIERVIDTLKRRPCSAEGLASSLGLDEDKINEQIEILKKKNIIRSENRSGEEFYIVI
ncbi:MAG: radical SAM protein [Sedimentisphaeraceae bacterium JB056]